MMTACKLTQKLPNVKLLVLDVDGALTDGGIHLGEQGQALRRFHVHDGLGIKSLC